MKKNNAEKILSEAVKLTTPDIFDSILSNCECAAKRGEVVNMEEIGKSKVNAKGWGKRAIATAAALAIILGTAFCFGELQKADAAETSVSVDAGSNVTVGVNKDNVVVSVSDNKSGISKSDVKGKDVKVAMGTIVEKMVKSGDISEDNNIVLLSVEAFNNKMEEGQKEVSDEVNEELTDAQKEMQEELADAINEVLQELGIKAGIIGQRFNNDKAVDEMADEFSISKGKASFIKKVLEAENDDDADIDIAKLATKSISEIVQYAAVWMSKNGVEIKNGSVSITGGSQTTVTAGNGSASAAADGSVNVNVGTDANVIVGSDANGSFETHVNADDGDVKVDVNSGANSSLGVEVDGERFVYDSSDPTGSIIGIIGSIIKAS